MTILVGSGESLGEAFNVHQRKQAGDRSLPPLRGGGRSCTEQRKEVSDSGRRTKTTHVRKAATQAACPPLTHRRGLQALQEDLEAGQFGLLHGGHQDCPIPLCEAKELGWDESSSREGMDGPLCPPDLPPVNMGTGAQRYRAGEGHMGQPRAEQRVVPFC